MRKMLFVLAAASLLSGVLLGRFGVVAERLGHGQQGLHAGDAGLDLD